MAHYAFLDSNNVVYQVIVGKDENEDGIDWEKYYDAKRTSYNTRGGVYYNSATNEPHEDQSKAYRKNYAGIGFTYDETRDAFIPPKPFESWVLNEFSCIWEAPVAYPNDGNRYSWNEESISWVLIETNE
jgi:hypothetical protein